VRILVINPNSSRVFTEIIESNIAPLRASGAYHIDCVGLSGTPAGIETQRDIDSVVEPLCKFVAAESDRTDAFVVACFADPGLFSAREMTAKPVIGICQSGLSTALNLGERYGVISTSSAGRNAELKLVRSYGLHERCAGFEPVEMSVVDIPASRWSQDRVLAAGERLKAQGADVLVLGCAGMAPHKSTLQEELRLPVVDPTVSATAMAIGIALQNAA
jgi:Asp/Glu/hydantoin racemase